MVDRRPFWRLLVAVAVAIGMGAFPWAAHAVDEPGAKHDDPVAAEARKHYEEGTKAFNLGEYPRAISEFKMAYNAKPDPLLLYNIAQAFRLGGDLGQALFFYRSFLRNMPAAPNRKEVEGRIRTLEKQVDEQKREAATAPAATAPTGALPPATSPSPSGTTTPTPPPATPSTSPPRATGSVPPPPPSSSASETKPPRDETLGKKPADKTSEAPSSAAVAPTAPPPLVAEPVANNPGADLSQPPAEEAPGSSHFYKKWWFWTGVGAVLVIGIVAVAARDRPPSSTYDLHNPTFIPAKPTP